MNCKCGYHIYRKLTYPILWPGREADHSPPSSVAVMEQLSYTSTHPVGHTGPVTGTLYLSPYAIYRTYLTEFTGTYFTLFTGT